MGFRQALRVATWVASVGVLLPGLTGCAMLNSFLDPTKVGQFPAEYQERGIRRILTPHDGPMGVRDAAEPTPEDLVPIFADYRLNVGDVVAVVVPDLIAPGAAEQVAMEITPTGNIRIPQLGSVKIDGLTEQEAEQEINARLREARLLSEPETRVYAQSRRGRTFTIRGAVGAPGMYPIPEPGTRLLDVIGMVQDISPTVQRFYVIRRAAGGAPAGTAILEPLPVVPAQEDLVIPLPPVDEDFEFSFSTAGGSVRVTEPPPDMAELEAVIAPPAAGGPPVTPEAGAELELPLEPLVFDPITGELMEARRAEERPTAEGPRAAGQAFPRGPYAEDYAEPFDWEDVPELELEQRVIEIDARALFAGDPRFNIVVRDRDVINVPVDTGVYYLMGEVARPGAFAFGGREITIKQALASAGGFAPFAWPQRCEIIRREPGTDRQITIPVNVDAVFAGLADDVFLRDEDIVNVGTHFVAPFLFVIRNSFRFTYGFGFVYDRNFADKDAYSSRINPETLRIQERQSRGLSF